MPQHYHEGELTVQALEQAAAMARTFRTSLPAPLVRFLATQRWIIVGATDTAGRVSASPVVGAPTSCVPPTRRPYGSTRSL